MASEATSPPPGSRWTGRTDFTLLNGRGWQAGSVTVAIDSATVTLRHGNRELAVLDRDRFRAWLRDPRDQLQLDDVTWFTRTGLTCISIHGLGTFVVPGNSVEQLLAVM